ncbi:hypothetical protein F7725_025159 [Dissostichus mawsoni]|uniref:CUB domain-containing protein n=1 Tax=Dissostichus mawsoni TaxID=36200 RepID=A0A7J5XAC7_DISMA|nr:hypothetical protein F7725_025159 [Dissostichus mawsoni]
MTEAGASILRITGFQVPPPVTSTGNVFSLRLTSDFAVSAHGFKLNYEVRQHYEDENTSLNTVSQSKTIFTKCYPIP